RRSLYFRHANDKQMEFLKIFDGASAIECYQRTDSIIPHQALALVNSDLTRTHARLLAEAVVRKVGVDPAEGATVAFQGAICRPPTAEELSECTAFLQAKAPSAGGDGGKTAPDPVFLRACENLVHGLMNHYEFRTLR